MGKAKLLEHKIKRAMKIVSLTEEKVIKLYLYQNGFVENPYAMVKPIQVRDKAVLFQPVEGTPRDAFWLPKALFTREYGDDFLERDTLCTPSWFKRDERLQAVQDRWFRRSSEEHSVLEPAYRNYRHSASAIFSTVDPNGRHTVILPDGQKFSIRVSEETEKAYCIIPWDQSVFTPNNLSKKDKTPPFREGIET